MRCYFAKTFGLGLAVSRLARVLEDDMRHERLGVEVKLYLGPVLVCAWLPLWKKKARIL